MRRLCILLAIATGFAVTPVVAAEPQQAAAQEASAADIDRLLEVMDMQSVMGNMLKQMGEVQEATIAQAFGANLSDKDKAEMSDFMRRTQAKVQTLLSWDKLEPILRRVYAKLFTSQEVAAMIAFYGSTEGQSILKKSPQAMALTAQEMQPLMQGMMADLKSELDKELADRKR